MRFNIMAIVMTAAAVVAGIWIATQLDIIPGKS